jgi:aspartate/methionine/tyrosine aminotransferase
VPRTPLSLPDFPWDALVPFGDRARRHPGGIVDLSVGSPVDPTPQIIRDALKAATDAHAYPQVAGTPQLREAIVEWYSRRRGVHDLTVANVLPSGLPGEFTHTSLVFSGHSAGSSLASTDAPARAAPMA